MKKIMIALMVLAATLMISLPVTVKADTGWRNVDGEWYYYYTDTSYYSSGICKIGGKGYLFDDHGRMQTGWSQRTGFADFWYYAESSGALVTGWKQISGKWYYFDPTSFYMYYNSRYEIDGKQYYFGGYGMPGGLGAMQTGWIKEEYTYEGNHYINWYYANQSGVLLTGWQKIGGKWYYFRPNTCIMYKNGYYEIGGKYYFFYESGAMGTGWCKQIYPEYDNYVVWYYADSSGVLQTGWQKINGVWYYLDKNSFSMAQGGWRDIDGKRYYFGDNGAMLTGWIKTSYIYDGVTYIDWYYADSNGSLVSEWRMINGIWYYFYPSDNRLAYGGRRMINEVFYYFADSGAMLTGWIKNTYTYEGTTYVEWYYGDSSGRLVEGWRKIDGIWYYFQPGNATMYRNVRLSIDGHGYFFLSSGAMKQGGWCCTEGGGSWYYAHDDGTLHEGWLNLNGSTYYLDPTYNFMYVGYRYIDGKWYEFDSSGRLIS